MKKRQLFMAIAFGAMLAITGCGDDEGDNGGGGDGGSAGTGGTGGSAGTGGTGGSNGDNFCTSLCEVCGGGATDCEQACELGFGSIPPEFLNSCPSEFDTLTSCFEANDCDGDVCDSELTAWAECVTENLTP